MQRMVEEEARTQQGREEAERGRAAAVQRAREEAGA